MSFSYEALQRLIPTTIHPSLSYFEPKKARERVDQFRSLLPCVPLSTPTYTVEFLELLTTVAPSAEVYSALPTFDYTLNSEPSAPVSFVAEPVRYTREIRFHARVAELLGPWKGELLRFAEAELEAMYSAALIYGKQGSWDGWPGNLFTELGGAPMGLQKLCETVTLDSGGDEPLCAYDFNEELFSLLAFNAALSRVPMDRPWFFVANQNLVSYFYLLWDTIQKQPPPMVPHPFSGGLVPSYAGVPILINNFIATAEGEGHPEGEPGCTSLYLLSPGVEHRRRQGLFSLCPKAWGRPYTVEFERIRDPEDALALRLHLEFALAFSSPADFFRVHNIRLFSP